MRKASRAILVHDGQLLVMRRNKFGQKYHALPGGGIDPGETPEAALYREMREETCLEIANPRLVVIEDAGDMYGLQYLFVADYIGGEPKLAPDSEEALITAMGQNTYEPVWLPLEALEAANFMPKDLLPVLLNGIQKGWEEEPISLTVRW